DLDGRPSGWLTIAKPVDALVQHARWDDACLGQEPEQERQAPDVLGLELRDSVLLVQAVQARDQGLDRRPGKQGCGLGVTAANSSAGVTLKPPQAQYGKLRGVLAGRCHARPRVALDQADRQPTNPVTA